MGVRLLNPCWSGFLVAWFWLFSATESVAATQCSSWTSVGMNRNDGFLVKLLHESTSIASAVDAKDLCREDTVGAKLSVVRNAFVNQALLNLLLDFNSLSADSSATIKPCDLVFLGAQTDANGKFCWLDGYCRENFLLFDDMDYGFGESNSSTSTDSIAASVLEMLPSNSCFAMDIRGYWRNVSCTAANSTLNMCTFCEFHQNGCSTEKSTKFTVYVYVGTFGALGILVLCCCAGFQLQYGIFSDKSSKEKVDMKNLVVLREKRRNRKAAEAQAAEGELAAADANGGSPEGGEAGAMGESEHEAGA